MKQDWACSDIQAHMRADNDVDQSQSIYKADLILVMFHKRLLANFEVKWNRKLNWAWVDAKIISILQFARLAICIPSK